MAAGASASDGCGWRIMRKVSGVVAYTQPPTTYTVSTHCMSVLHVHLPTFFFPFP